MYRSSSRLLSLIGGLVTSIFLAMLVIGAIMLLVRSYVDPCQMRLLPFLPPSIVDLLLHLLILLLLFLILLMVVLNVSEIMLPFRVSFVASWVILISVIYL